MQKIIFFVSCLFLATSLAHGFPNGYLPDLSGIPFISYFTSQDTPPEKQIISQDEVLNADDPLPVDEFLDIIEEDKAGTKNELEKEKITETLQSLNTFFADDTLQQVKVLYRNAWHAVNLGVPGSSGRLRSAQRTESLWERFVNMLSGIRDAILEMFGLKEKDPKVEKENGKDEDNDNDESKAMEEKHKKTHLVQPVDQKKNQKPEAIKFTPETKPPTVLLSEVKPPEIKLPTSANAAKQTLKDESIIPKSPAIPNPENLLLPKSSKPESKDGDLGEGSESGTYGSNNPSTKEILTKPPKKEDSDSLSEREKVTTDAVHRQDSKTVTIQPEITSSTMMTMSGNTATDAALLATMFGQLAAGDAAAKAQSSSDQKAGLTNSSPQAGQKTEEKQEGAATAAKNGVTTTEPKKETFKESVERLKTEIQQGSKDDATKQRMKQELDNIFLNKKELGPDEAISMTDLLNLMSTNGILAATDVHIYGQKIMERNTKLKSLMMKDIDT